jgi:lipid A disaccharide synthetase
MNDKQYPSSYQRNPLSLLSSIDLKVWNPVRRSKLKGFVGSNIVIDADITKELLEKECQNSRNLDAHVRRLLEEADEAANRVEASQTKEKELTDRCREQVCRLQAEAVSPILIGLTYRRGNYNSQLRQ